MARACLRTVYGEYIVKAGKKNKDIVALEADLKESTQSIQFQKAFPGRYLDVGIAEQNMVGIAAGLALAGKIPVVHSFACFISMRSLEQVRTTVAYPNLNVKFVVTHAGISTGSAGTTHHATEDIAIMRSIPNMTVIAPADARELRQAVDAAIKHKGPVYIRLGCGEAEDVYTDKDKFRIGKANRISSGNDATLITTGSMAAEGLEAVRNLRDHGIKVRLLHMATIKPIDEQAVIRAAQETSVIVTVEEHSVLGGLGAAVCEIAAGVKGACVKRIGISDCFCGVGSSGCLMNQQGLTSANISAEILKLLKGKKVLQ